MTKYCFSKHVSYKPSTEEPQKSLGEKTLLVFIRKDAMGSSGASKIIITDRDSQFQHSNEANCQQNWSSTSILHTGCCKNICKTLQACEKQIYSYCFR